MTDFDFAAIDYMARRFRGWLRDGATRNQARVLAYSDLRDWLAGKHYAP